MNDTGWLGPQQDFTSPPPAQVAAWQAQTVWHVDSVNGNDTNTGLDADNALKTTTEYMQRVGGVCYATPASIFIHNSITDKREANFTGVFTTTSAVVYVAIIGVPTELHSGTLTAVQTNNGTTQNQRWTITDSALTSGWTGLAGHYVRGLRNGVPTWRAFVIADLGSNTAMIDTPVSVQASPTAFSSSLRQPQVGDTYVVESFPSFPSPTCDGAAYEQLRFVTLNLTANDGFGVDAEVFPATRFVLCSFEAPYEGESFRTNFIKCAFLQGGNFLTPSVCVDCYFTGSVLTFTNSPQNWNGLRNVFRSTSMSVLHNAKFDHTGTLFFWDCTLAMVTADLQSRVLVDRILGDTNTGPIFAVNRTGSWIAAGKTGVLVSTTNPTPFAYTGVGNYTLDDLPISFPKAEGGLLVDGTTPTSYVVDALGGAGTARRISYGTQSPASDSPPQLWLVGDTRYNLDVTSPVDRWINTVAGRPGTWQALTRPPVKIDEQALASATTYSSPTWTADLYREIIVTLWLSSASASVQSTLTLAGLSGAYASQRLTAQGATVTGVADAANWALGILTKGSVRLVISRDQGQETQLVGQGTVGSALLTLAGTNTDLAGGVTGLAIAFGAASSGRVEVWGVPRI